jgi:gag-polyprotein putative aspartyl protease
MTKYFNPLFLYFLVNSLPSFAQDDFIRSKEGKPVLKRREIISKCIKSLHKPSNDIVAIKICECRADKLDGYFTNQEYRQHTNGPIIQIDKMLDADSVISKEMEVCARNSGQLTLLHAQGFKEEFVKHCMEGVQKNTSKKLDSIKLKDFCTCQLNLVKSKRISDAEIETLSNPNTLLFYEMMYTCGNPFSNNNSKEGNWNAQMVKDITGPASDTINILSFNGMSYVKIKTGSMVQFWLFDTGASDLLINAEMEEKLKAENILNEDNYVGTEQYEMANGSLDICKKYTINNIRIGNYSVSNVQVAVSQTARKIIAGRSLMNKFSNWVINNANNTLVLTK